MFELAARRKALAFIHMRSAGEVEPGGSIDALQEVLANVAATGASVHIVHIASMGLRQTPRLLAMIDGARARGLDVTTEVYPYTAASTYLQSALFDPGWQERFAIGFQGRAVGGDRRTAHRGKLRPLPRAGRPRRDSHDSRRVGASRAVASAA